MSIIVETFISCDNCGNNYGVDCRSYTGAMHRRNAKAEGWRYYNGKDYCPNCKDCAPLKREAKNDNENFFSDWSAAIKQMKVN